MKMQMMTIYDKALGAYMQPWFAQSVGQANRMFQDEINRPDGDMHKHPADYDLYHIGEWNNETGMLEPNGDHPKQITTGANAIIQKQ